jgi:aerobic-type carbon monoxide dehydrogenase small subunit (CoxS/CutS family)
MPISVVLNGKPATLDADPTMPLLWAVPAPPEHRRHR